jgi:uncharacterized phiE125 gp8 family phage protein
LELILDQFPNRNYIEFKSCSPVQSIINIKITDKDGAVTTMAASDYILDNDSFVNRIVLGYGIKWPAVTLQPVNGIRIQFVAGYGNATVVPETVKQAMVLHMRLMFDSYKPEERKALEKTRDNLLGLRRVMPV